MPGHISTYQKFIRIFLPASTIIFIALIALYEWQQFSKSRMEIIGKLEMLTSTYSLLLAEPVVRKNVRDLDSYIVSLLSDNDIILVHITHSDSTPLYRFGDRQEVDRNQQRSISVTYASGDGITNAGTLTLGVTLERITQQSHERLQLSTALFLAFIVFITVLSYFAFQSSIGKPLQAIINAMRSFKQSTTPTPIAISYSKEINQVAETFNSLQERVASQQRELQYLLANKSEALNRESSELRETTAKLNETRHMAQITLDSLGEAVFTTDANGEVTYCNPAAARYSHAPLDTINGKLLTDIFLLRNPEESFERNIKALLAGEISKIEIPEITITNLERENIIVSILIIPLLDTTQHVIGISLVARNITDSKLLENKLSYEATHDPLTGLLNRRGFEVKMHDYIQDAVVNNTHHVICYLDLDYFKNINDSCGHQAGDELLRDLTREFKSWLRSNDIIARLGGDEFCILLNNCSLVDAESLCNKIIHQVSGYQFRWNGQIFSVGASIGIVPITIDSAGSADELLHKADTACYTAKDKGRNQTQAYS